MEDWKVLIGNDVKQLINIDAFAKNYLSKINNNLKLGKCERESVALAKADLRKILIEYGIKAHDIAHLIHFCGMAIYPQMYKGCGCHDHLKVFKFNN